MENYPSSNQDIPNPPAHLVPEQRWLAPNPNVEHISLAKGESFLVDTAAEGVIDTTEFGLPSESDGFNLRVVGAVEVKSHEDAPEARIALVREVTPAGAELFHMVSQKQGNASEPLSWNPLPLGLKVTVGRNNTTEDKTFLDGSQLTGKPFSEGVSRKHFEIELTDEGILVTDTSTNHTDVEAVRKQPSTVRAIGAVAAKTSNPELISDVPKSDKEAREALAAEKAAKEAKRAEPLIQNVRKLEAQIDKIKGKYDADTQFSMARYANAWIAKREAQKAEDGNESYRQESLASQAYNSLPKTAQSDASTVIYLMQKVDQLNDQILGR